MVIFKSKFKKHVKFNIKIRITLLTNSQNSLSSTMFHQNRREKELRLPAAHQDILTSDRNLSVSFVMMLLLHDLYGRRIFYYFVNEHK